MRQTWYRSGDWNAICDVCGFKFKNTALKKRWDGLMVCDEDWEQRHPQELIRPIADQNKLPWTRPEGSDQFITLTYNPSILQYCTVTGQLCLADYATADCAIVGNIIPPI